MGLQHIDTLCGLQADADAIDSAAVLGMIGEECLDGFSGQRSSTGLSACHRAVCRQDAYLQTALCRPAAEDWLASTPSSEARSWGQQVAEFPFEVAAREILAAAGVVPMAMLVALDALARAPPAVAVANAPEVLPAVFFVPVVLVEALDALVLAPPAVAVANAREVLPAAFFVPVVLVEVLDALVLAPPAVAVANAPEVLPAGFFVPVLRVEVCHATLAP
jgi:hypothetical protein